MRLLINYPQWFDGRFFQLLAVVTGTLSAVSDGMAYGWTAPVLPILRNTTTTPVEINTHDENWLEHLYLIGGISGFPLTMYCVDRIGRKKTILLAAILQVISWTLIGFAESVELLFIPRFIAGLAGDVAFVTAPMYIAEIADQHIRGFLGGMVYLMMLLGVLMVYLIAPFVSILTLSMVAVAIGIVQLLTFPFVPETPYFLLLNGKQMEATTSLKWLRSSEDVQKELEEISKAVERQRLERGRFIDLFVVPSNRKAFIILVTLNAAQHLSSITVLLMNIHTILADAATILTASTAAIIFSAIMLIAASSSSLLVDKVGRKALLISSSLLSGASVLALAIYFTAKNSNFDVTGYNWLPVVAVMVYAAAFKCGLGLIPIVMTGELFPTSVKAFGMTISDVSFFVFGIISIFLYQQLEKNFGMHWPFFVFSVFCVFTALFTTIYIPETKGRFLEEIQFILKEEPLPDLKQNGQKCADGGRVNRTDDSELQIIAG